MIKPRRLIGALALGFLLSVGLADGQDPGTTAPIKWQRYTVEGTGVSVLLPKVPVRFDDSSPCDQTVITELYAYAAESVYEFRIARKSAEPVPEWCPGKKKFGRDLLEARVAELAKDGAAVTTVISKPAQTQVTIATTRFSTRWIYDDVKNNRWVEVCVTKRPGASDSDDADFKSVEFSGGDGSIDVAAGSEVTIGDEIKDEPVTQSSQSKTIEKPEGVVIVVKKRAPWSTEARGAGNIQGTVLLRVTFLANGSIGSVAPVKGLPYGLTEEAIAAVRKLMFLPSRSSGKPANVTRTIEYSFGIY